MLSNSLIALLGIALLILVVNLPVHVVFKFVLGIAAMYLISKLFSRQTGIKDDWGMLMVRSKAGLRTIDALAKNENAWKLFADLGTVVAYGTLSFFIIRRPLKERALVVFAGLVVLSLLSLLVAPVVFPFLIGILGTEGLAAKSSVATGSQSALVAAGLLYLGGFSLMVFGSLISYAVVVLSAVIGALFFGTHTIQTIAPGATLILPGINIPFAEGIIALALILLVHEGAHAVLARIARVKILSSGVVLLGVLPIGAFVEPDEDQLKKVDSEKQSRVLVAGSTANLFASLAAFFLFLGFLFVTVPYKESGLLVVGGNQSGTVIYTINGQNASTFAAGNLTANSTLAIGSSRGAYEVTLGKGQFSYYDLSSTFFLAKYSNPALEFIYNLLGLIFSLNFVIGIVNLLPLPFFDGYRLLELNVDKKMAVTAISWIAALAFLVNFLPWFF
ncbi:Peptidase family M50 [uncultured archaeon]|nr:Peptidase family M50 [uncultured archaeon]